MGLASYVRPNGQTAGLLVHAHIDSSILLELQKNIPCRGDEVAVADVRPSDVTNAVVESNQVSRGDTHWDKHASGGLIVVAGRTTLVPGANPCSCSNSLVIAFRSSDTVLIYKANQAYESERSLMSVDHEMRRSHLRDDRQSCW